MTKIFTVKQEELKSIQKMNTKEIQDIIYPEKKKAWPYKEIWQGKIRKQIGFNYTIIQDILNIIPNEPSIFCRKADEFETRDHLFLKCEALLPFRKDIQTWLTVLNNDHNYAFNVNNIVYMEPG